MRWISIKIIFKFILLIVAIVTIFYFKGDIVFFIKKIQLNIIHNIIFHLKKENYIFIIFSLIYGIIHGFSPGHGKLLLLSKSLKYEKRKLLFYGFYIVYMQGLMSIFVIKYLKTLKSANLIRNIKYFDMTSLKIYGVTLIIIEAISYLNNTFFLKKNYIYSILITGLLPCAGILNILCIITFFNNNSLILLIALSISTGMFITIACTVYLANRINNKFIHLEVIKEIISYINSVIIIIFGILIVLLTI